MDPMAYFAVKQILKQERMSRHYRSIFTILYKCGGVRPRLHHVRNAQEFYARCVQTYTQMAHYFYRSAAHTMRRTSMPSTYMLLDLIMREHGHEPYYFIPQLQDENLRNAVLTFYSNYHADILHPQRHQGSSEASTKAFLSMYPRLPVLRPRVCAESDYTLALAHAGPVPEKAAAADKADRDCAGRGGGGATTSGSIADSGMSSHRLRVGGIE